MKFQNFRVLFILFYRSKANELVHTIVAFIIVSVPKVFTMATVGCGHVWFFECFLNGLEIPERNMFLNSNVIMCDKITSWLIITFYSNLKRN